MKQLTDPSELIGKRIKAYTDASTNEIVLLFDDDTFVAITAEEDDGSAWPLISDWKHVLSFREQEELGLITTEQRLAKEQAEREEQARLEKEERRKRYEAMKAEFESTP